MSEKKGFLKGLFGGSKEDGCCSMEIVEEKPCCCSKQTTGEGTIATENLPGNEAITSIKVLGTGCKKCETLYKTAQQVVQQLGIAANVEHITDLVTVAGYGVMVTPALVINEKVVSTGKVLKAAELEALLK